MACIAFTVCCIQSNWGIEHEFGHSSGLQWREIPVLAVFVQNRVLVVDRWSISLHAYRFGQVSGNKRRKSDTFSSNACKMDICNYLFIYLFLQVKIKWPNDVRSEQVSFNNQRISGVKKKIAAMQQHYVIVFIFRFYDTKYVFFLVKGVAFNLCFFIDIHWLWIHCFSAFEYSRLFSKYCLKTPIFLCLFFPFTFLRIFILFKSPTSLPPKKNPETQVNQVNLMII